MGVGWFNVVFGLVSREVCGIDAIFGLYSRFCGVGRGFKTCLSVEAFFRPPNELSIVGIRAPHRR